MPERLYAPVKKLSEQCAKKIAAGEVIDRPAAVIRELIDNALDAGATKIQVEIDGGGIDRIRIVDNGCGMSKEDLELCTFPHTTSKISDAQDLLDLRTLGFRGEALSSVSAVSHLSITSTRNPPEAWKLRNSMLGATPQLEAGRLNGGTIVEVSSLFENFPARKKFLKRPSAESTMCKNTFIEKALPHFKTAMNFSIQGKTVLQLPKHDSYKARCLAARGIKEPETLFYELQLLGDSFSGTLVLGSPAVSRKDSKNIFIFVNNRRIQEYSLVQAIRYGAEGAFPNGAFPIAFLFLTVDPACVDFNIHPAKREARIQVLSAIHHAVSSTVSNFYTEMARVSVHSQKEDNADTAEAPSFFDTASRNVSQSQTHKQNAQRFSDSLRFAEKSAFYRKDVQAPSEPLSAQPVGAYSSEQHTYSESREEAIPYGVDVPIDSPSASFKFLGQVMATFLLVEKDDSLYVIDQHATHERVLFDEMQAEKGASQELLVPYRITTDGDEDDKALHAQAKDLRALGFELEQIAPGRWHVSAVPIYWTGSEQDLQHDLVDSKKHPKGILYHILARASCRAACKAGDILDSVMAYRLAEKAFTLPEAFCPHGRPVWTRLSRDELFERVKRT